MRAKIGKPVKSRASTSKLFKRFRDSAHLIEVAEFCEANGYQGLKPEYCAKRKGDGKSPGQKTMEASW